MIVYLIINLDILNMQKIIVLFTFFFIILYHINGQSVNDTKEKPLLALNNSSKTSELYSNLDNNINIKNTSSQIDSSHTSQEYATIVVQFDYKLKMAMFDFFLDNQYIYAIKAGESVLIKNVSPGAHTFHFLTINHKASSNVESIDLMLKPGDTKKIELVFKAKNQRDYFRVNNNKEPISDYIVVNNITELSENYTAQKDYQNITYPKHDPSINITGAVLFGLDVKSIANTNFPDGSSNSLIIPLVFEMQFPLVKNTGIFAGLDIGLSYYQYEYSTSYDNSEVEKESQFSTSYLVEFGYKYDTPYIAPYSSLGYGITSLNSEAVETGGMFKIGAIYGFKPYRGGLFTELNMGLSGGWSFNVGVAFRGISSRNKKYRYLKFQ